MGRLENIIARNRRPHGVRATLGLLWRGLILIFILGALLFTDWALTDEERAARELPAARPPAVQPLPAQRRLDGVPVLRPSPRHR